MKYTDYRKHTTFSFFVWSLLSHSVRHIDGTQYVNQKGDDKNPVYSYKRVFLQRIDHTGNHCDKQRKSNKKKSHKSNLKRNTEVLFKLSHQSH